MKSRILTTIFAVTLAITSWANGIEIGEIYYVLDIDSETASVTYTGSSSSSPNPAATAYKGSITIPSSVTYERVTYSVTSIGGFAFQGCSDLTSIDIPNSVTSIGQHAFQGCSGLTNVTIPNSVTSIEYSVFYNCTGLRNVTIGNSVTSIGSSAFVGCRIENVLAKNSKTTCSYAFSDRTYQHAMLYIPEGTWNEAIYDGDWYMFNNIRETTINVDALSQSRVYTLMDTHTFGYAICNETSGEVTMAKAFYSFDEQDLNNCWLVIKKAGEDYLYNVGAKKYATINAEGRISLTDIETPIEITEGEDGIRLGADNGHQWAFVKNNCQIDITGITPPLTLSEKSVNRYYSIDGRRSLSSQKGINIVRMSDGTTKKIFVK